MRQKFDAKGSEFLSFAALAPLREETSFVLFATFVVTPGSQSGGPLIRSRIAALCYRLESARGYWPGSFHAA
jgi:hypothetical protein